MQEDFLHFVWKGLLPKKTLVTVSGEKVVVECAGEHNHDAGPDFISTVLRMAGATWAGSAEIHVRSSDWYRHGHDKDPAYDNVILHLVYDYDAPVYRATGEEIPAVIMKGLIPERAYSAYLEFLNNHLWIPCAMEIGRVKPDMYHAYMEDLGMQRIEKRSEHLEQLVQDQKGDWNQAFFISLASTLGTRINKDPFEMLARNTPFQVILKNRDTLVKLEALIFGQAGFLDLDHTEEYPRLLADEYTHLKRKYSLKGIPVHLWKFLRLRPVNFPTVRLAQLSAIYYHHPLLFGELVDENEAGNWKNYFQARLTGYWQSHYSFGRSSPDHEKSLGKDMIDLILINSVVPLLYTFRQRQGLDSPGNIAGQCLDIPPESNSIILKFSHFGIDCNNALQTQGLLELKKNWCDLKKCLECRIGLELLKSAL